MPEMPASAKTLVGSRPYRWVIRRKVVPWMLQGEHPRGAGLEIGAGAGAITAHLLELHPRLRMVATDYDPDLVARATVALAGYGDRATAGQADACALPFDDEAFDFVLSAAMLHHTVDWEQALAEVARVLRPGGRLVGYDLLDTRTARLMHGGKSHETRLLRRGEVEGQCERLGLTDVRSRLGLGGLVVRFAATKPRPPEPS